MDTDDQQIGRILSRREVFTLLGAAGAAVAGGRWLLSSGVVQPTAADAQVAATATPAGKVYLPVVLGPNTTPTATTAATVGTNPTTISGTATPTATSGALPACIVRPEVTEGPYYVDEQLNRSDIRSDTSTGAVKAGALLALTFSVSHVTSAGCTPFAGAVVDIWHCDAAGTYSDVSDRSFNTTGQNFLRGYQVTDANGLVTFTTIYPGWYSGRAVHIHFKIRTSATDHAHEFTSQLFFDDSFTDQVFTQAPYASKGQRNTLNSNDTIYQDLLLLSVNTTAEGYATTFPIGVDLS